MVRLLMGMVALAVMTGACTESGSPAPGAPATTPVPSTTVPTTITTAEGRCPDVFCLVYHIHPAAVWSDGTPVTAHDFAFTYETAVAGGDTVDAAGYELITGHEVVDDKTLLVVFSQVYGPWQTLFDRVLPMHAPDHALAVASGPFVLVGTDQNGTVLRRNPEYWAEADPLSGRPLGDVEEIRFVVVDGARDKIRRLGNGEIDVIDLRPLDWMVEEVAALESATFQVGPGPFWEHITFNHDDPMLSQHWVREAIALALDRERILDETVRAIHPEAVPLGNTVWMVNSSNYEDHLSLAYQHDPDAAEEILIDQGCEREEGGIYSCQGRRMSFIWVTTVGDELRDRQPELVRDDLEAIGIELVSDQRLPSDLFASEVLFAGPETWQLISFAWKASEDPHLGNTMYHCAGMAPSGFGELNVGRYCNETVEGLIRSTDSTPDPEDRAALYNEADHAYLRDLGSIPLYQRPSLLAWSGELSGPELNMSGSAHLWNVGAWAGTEAVVVAIDTEPSSLDPAGPLDDTAAMILAAIFHGAYGVGPSLDPAPVLVERVETIVSDR